MTPETMAAIYAGAFPDSRAWSPAEIAALTRSPAGFAVHEPGGFVLGRAVAGEAELLTVAVAADQRRKGTARRLLAAFEAEAVSRGAGEGFLEVAADNTPALALYRTSGWAEIGRRQNYYARNDRTVDAILMSKPLI